MNKVPIAEGQMDGNLRVRTQSYRINFLPEEEDMCPKLEVAILLISPKGDIKSEYRSIRFTNAAQIKSFLVGIIKGYFLFGRLTKEITAANFRYRLTKLQRDIEKSLLQAMHT